MMDCVVYMQLPTHFSPSFCCVTSLASVACSDISLANADDVFPLAMLSNKRPRETNNNNMGGVSKNVFGTTLVYVAPMITTMTLLKNNNYCECMRYIIVIFWYTRTLIISCLYEAKLRQKICAWSCMTIACMIPQE